MAEGVVKQFSPKKGYGFIEQEQMGPAAKNVTIV